MALSDSKATCAVQFRREDVKKALAHELECDEGMAQVVYTSCLVIYTRKQINQTVKN